MSASRPRILIVIDYYLPGYRGGGPIRTISHLVDHLGHLFDFSIVTRDRDLGDEHAYRDVDVNTWHARGRSRVLYRSSGGLRLGRWIRLLRDTPHDLLYLNSVFSRTTMALLILRRLGAIPRRPTILAPRGELSPGAVNLKRRRKHGFLTVAQRLGLFDGLVWQASSDLERTDILQTLKGAATRIEVAVDLPPRAQGGLPARRMKSQDVARIVFVSRLVRKKNLDFAIQLLAHAEGRILFDIYGPREDLRYWNECAALMETLPANVTTAYRGDVAPAAVSELFTQYDLLLFPTLSENFGYVILEALTGGCPVLISDTTPWRNLAEHMAGWDLPLSEPQRFVTMLQQVVAMDHEEHRRWSEGARTLAATVSNDENAVKASRLLLDQTLGVRS
jgi:glycosyltransferase involved in cell wall biosynthesis